MHTNDAPQMLLGLLALSFAFYTIVNRWNFLRIPSVVIYIVFGALIGNSSSITGFDLYGSIVTGLGKFGFLFLMFLSGMEIDTGMLAHPPKIRRRTAEDNAMDNNPSPLRQGFLLFLGTTALSIIFALIVAHFDSNVKAWMMALILSTSSLGIIVPVLKEVNMTSTLYGQTLLIAALLADMVTLLCVSIGGTLALDPSPLQLFWIGVLIIPLYAAYLVLKRASKQKTLRHYVPHEPIDQVRGILAFLALCSLVAGLSGTEPIMGSFLAGLVIASLQFAGKERLKQHAEAIGYGFIIPIFFITVGMHFHAQQFFGSRSSWLWVPFLLLGSYVVKVLPSLWLAGKTPSRKAFAGGVLLSSRLSLVIAASSIGLRIGAITPTIADALLVVAVATCFISPVVFMWLL